jgi:hypothetical protein
MGVLGLFRRKKNDPVTLAGGPGDSVENAVIIHCSDYFAGNRAEYQYLEKKCGTFITDWTLDVKMLIKKDGRNYDLIGIKMEDGRKRTFYFDSTEMLKCLNLEIFGIR